MYDSFLASDSDLNPLLRGYDPARFHIGDAARLLRMHERHAALAASGRCPELPPIGPLLMGRLADDRTMYVALLDLIRKGDKAPGPNGHHLQDLDTSGLWSLARTLAAGIRDGTFAPGPERRVPIPKAGKPGEFRHLTVRNVEDRVVGRALLRICQPVLDGTLSPFAFGFRPGRNPQAALASALAYARAHHAWCWYEGDVEKAFDRVPLSQLRQALRHRLPADIVACIERVNDRGQKRGIPQGSPDAPLWFNVFVDHFLARPWHRRHPEMPLFTYADNLLLICRSREEARAAATELGSMARSAGTPLGGAPEEGIRDIAAGESLTWLGYLLQREGNRLAIRIAPQAWTNLSSRLAEAHLHADSPLRAISCIEGWLRYLGPCYPFEDHRQVLARIRTAAAALGFEEIDDERRLLKVWQAAHRRWDTICRHEASVLPHRLSQLKLPPPIGTASPAACTAATAAVPALPDERRSTIQAQGQQLLSALAQKVAGSGGATETESGADVPQPALTAPAPAVPGQPPAAASAQPGTGRRRRCQPFAE